MLEPETEAKLPRPPDTKRFLSTQNKAHSQTRPTTELWCSSTDMTLHWSWSSSSARHPLIFRCENVPCKSRTSLKTRAFAMRSTAFRLLQVVTLSLNRRQWMSPDLEVLFLWRCSFYRQRLRMTDGHVFSADMHTTHGDHWSYM